MGPSKHAGGALKGSFEPPSLDSDQQGFGVGVAATGTAQFLAKREVVLDLAVEGDHIAPALWGPR